MRLNHASQEEVYASSDLVSESISRRVVIILERCMCSASPIR